MATTKLILQKPYKTTSRTTPQTSAAKRKKILNPDETRLYLFLILDRDHVIKIKTEHVIYPETWDFKKQLKKEKLAGAPEFNKKLQELKEDFLDQYQKILEKYPDMTFDQVSQSLKEYGRHKEIPFLKKEEDFFKVMDKFIEQMNETKRPTTIKKFITLKKSLQEFGQANKKYKNFSFSMIDHGFKDDYTTYLRTQKPRGRQKVRPEGQQNGILTDTLAKYIQTLKTFLKWAEEREYNSRNTYKEFVNYPDQKLKKKDNDIVTLTFQELKQFYAHDFSDNPSLERVRDLFCFGCFTGQRWGDIEAFKGEDVEGDVWSFTARKTLKETEIDLIEYAAPALDILKKYNFQLPKISLQKFNLYLKEAAKIAGIDASVKLVRYVGAKEIEMTGPKHEFIASHTARKTCVSLLLNVFNVPVTNVMEITGHSDLKTLQRYISKDRHARREAMRKTKRLDEVLTVINKGIG